MMLRKELIQMHTLLITTVAVVILGVSSSAFGQTNPREGKDSKYPELRRQVTVLSDATVINTPETIIDLTHPVVVAHIGGRESFLALLKQVNNNFKSDGVQILSYNVGEIEQEARIGGDIFVVLSEVMLLRIKGSKYRAESSLIAISSDSGANWKFVAGTIGQARFDELFPKAAGRIKFKAMKTELVSN
jgi:hypothetical protein